MPALCANDLVVLDLHRDLGQRPWGRARDYLGTSGGVKDRAVARAGEVAALVGNCAALVCADRRVRHEVPVLQVDQDSGIPRVLERKGTPGRNHGRVRNNRPAWLCTASRRCLRVTIGAPAAGVTTAVVAAARVPTARLSTARTSTAGASSAGDQRGTGGTHSKRGAEPDEPLARNLLQGFLLVVAGGLLDIRNVSGSGSCQA